MQNKHKSGQLNALKTWFLLARRWPYFRFTCVLVFSFLTLPTLSHIFSRGDLALSLFTKNSESTKSPGSHDLISQAGDPYQYGIMPQNADTADAKAAYETWKSLYITSSGVPDPSNMLRVSTTHDGQGATTSEYQGYGMLFAAHLEEDDAILQKLWNYAEYYKNDGGLMVWHIDASGNAEWRQSALDGDMDIAMALDYAARRWPGRGWDVHAEIYINSTIAPQKNSFLRTAPIDITEWPRWKRGIYLNYLATAYMEHFSNRTGDERWSTIAIPNTYRLLNYSFEQFELPAWFVDEAGQPLTPNDPWNSQANRHDTGATRTNWRIASHYLTSGHENAKHWVDKLTAFFEEAGKRRGGYNTGDFSPTHLRRGYRFMATEQHRAGQPYGDRNQISEAMLVAAGVPAMAAGHIEMTNEIYDFLALAPLEKDDTSMDNAMHVMGLLIMSGGLDAIR